MVMFHYGKSLLIRGRILESIELSHNSFKSLSITLVMVHVLLGFEVHVLLGFDDESPYGPVALTERGRLEREANHVIVRKINEICDFYHAGRTFFLLGDYVAKTVEAEGVSYARELWRPENPLIEIGQHTYSHVTIAPIVTRPDKAPVSVDVLREEVRTADALIYRVLGVHPKGLRAPLGYAGGIPEDVAAVLHNEWLAYVSSDLRDKRGASNRLLLKTVSFGSRGSIFAVLLRCRRMVGRILI